MIATWAMLVDAYRELNHRKLFWITMIISVIVVAAMAIVGINDKGLTFLHWQLDTPEFSTAFFSTATFYKWIFITFGIKIWLTWAATILALVSTASLFPDFLTSGAIDLWLSKPISRLRLFLTKYVFGLLFVGLQVGLFTVASFLVLGFRGGVWEPRLLLAIPIVLAFFSFLFGFSVLFGVWTRSTIAALLMTFGVWFLLFMINSAEAGLHLFYTDARVELDRTAQRIDIQEKRPTPNLDRIAALHTEKEQWSDAVSRRETWHSLFYHIKTAVPKTDETIELLDRSLIDLSDVPGFDRPNDPPEQLNADGPSRDRRRGEPSATAQRTAMESRRSRSVEWVLGTSFAFEAFIVGLAAWIFCRRDY